MMFSIPGGKSASYRGIRDVVWFVVRKGKLLEISSDSAASDFLAFLLFLFSSPLQNQNNGSFRMIPEPGIPTSRLPGFGPDVSGFVSAPENWRNSEPLGVFIGDAKDAMTSPPLMSPETCIGGSRDLGDRLHQVMELRKCTWISDTASLDTFPSSFLGQFMPPTQRLYGTHHTASSLTPQTHWITTAVLD